MNYRWSMVLMLGTLMALPLRAVRADEEGGSGGEHRYEWKHGDRDHDGLGLTSDQKAKLKSIEEAQKTALKPLMRKKRDLMIKLSEQVDDKAADSDIEHTLSDLKSTREAMQTETKRFKTQREAIFTPTQKARMMLAHRHDRWDHEKMKDHRGDGWDGGKDGHEGHHHDDDDDHGENM